MKSFWKYTVVTNNPAMKGLFAIALSIFLALGCSEKDSGKLEGTWELRSFHGGLLPGNSYPAGEGPIITFAEGEYKRYLNDSLTAQGTYTTR